MKWFCPLPFYHIYSNSNGKWAACCLSKSPGHTTENTSLMEWYNSEHMNNLRDEMIGLSNSSENINAFCKICVNQEMNEGSSTRLKWISNLKSDRKKGVDKTVEEYVNTNKISFKDNNYRFLELKLRIFEKEPIAIIHHKDEKKYFTNKSELIDFIELEKFKQLPLVFGDGEKFEILYLNLKKNKFPLDEIKKYTDNKKIKKIIYIQDKLVNIVV